MNIEVSVMDEQSNTPKIVEAVDAAVASKEGGRDDIHPDQDVADRSYDAFRRAIGAHITAALQSGKVLVQEKATYGTRPGEYLASYGPLNFFHWRNALPASMHQHFNCDYCRSVWAEMAGIAAMDENGQLSYPVLEAARSIADSDEIIAKVMEELSNGERSRPGYMPLARLSEKLLTERVVGGFQHFYGVEDVNLVREYNRKRTSFADFQYVDRLFQQIIWHGLNVDLLAKVLVYVKANIGDQDHTALGRGDALVELIRSVRRVQTESRNGPLYLWSLLQVNDNSWMRHINGSLLGIVLDVTIELKDSDDMAAALTRVKALLKQATAGENYKQKTAEASEASLEQTFKFLTENNLRGSLSRRLLPLDEAKQVVWKGAAAEQVEAGPVGSALDAAFGELKQQKNPDLKANAKMDEILGDVEVRKTMSLIEFIRGLSEYQSLEITHESTSMLPVFVTAAAEEGDHAQLLNFVDGIHDTSLLLTTPQPYHYSVIAEWAGETSIVTPPASIDVAAVVRVARPEQEDSGYILHIEGFAPNFYNALSQYGSCILGTMIRSEHFGHSRALTELSKKMPMDVSAGGKGVGGIFCRVGTVLLAKLKNGTFERITITSVR
ncbi:hypothetical protein [Ralstonia phage RP31]|uniref:Uncharacterized protein n=2 Tax=Ripduovirus RP12 TaxID=2560700 RepID=A0A1L7N0Y7_9CAUD|nr:hypothetical protein FDH28_gp256 [Ralstonia phage RP12]BAW19139.1 hypothetical protein [Ralstonia phage RP12]BAW19425.1 hypothetical protein [Ralstonia phage RP31]